MAGGRTTQPEESTPPKVTSVPWIRTFVMDITFFLGCVARIGAWWHACSNGHGAWYRPGILPTLRA
ncbi:MAG: hypothetical protein ACTS5I_10335, partial [Rhodanobacter sp.]